MLRPFFSPASKNPRFLIFCIVCLVVCSLAACTPKVTDPAAEPADGSVAPAPAPDPGPTDFYYDFDDILVPKEMELQTNESFILETPNQKTGVMVFEGKVEILSLTSFFINNMNKDGWSLLSAFKSNRTILVFEKIDRICVMNITNGKFSTLLEIWVSPRSNSNASVPPAATSLTQ